MAKSQLFRIVHPDQKEPKQLGLFTTESTQLVRSEVRGVLFGYEEYPTIYRTQDEIRKLVEKTTDFVGLDLEFNTDTGRPTVVGLATEEGCGAVRWDADFVRDVVMGLLDRGVRLVGHAVVGADRPVIEAALGIRTRLDQWEDSMLAHYLAAQVLCKAPAKEEDKDDTGSLGFMGLWPAASRWTNLPQWKAHRGAECYGPCPRCDVFGYCAIDAFAGLVVYRKAIGHYLDRGGSYEFYRKLVHLADICDRMETRGVRVDLDYVKRFEATSEERKAQWFPHTVNGKTVVYTEFNPKSPDQVLSWFASKGVVLGASDKAEIQKTLEKLLKNHGYAFDKGEKLPPEMWSIVDADSGETVEDLPLVVDYLHRLFLFKSAGKGLDAWFSDKYVSRKDKRIHPRFIVTGTSTGRLSSSKPNFQNIPARGFGEEVRRCILPKDDDHELIKADFSQLELRMCLYLAGVDPGIIGDDAFTWLVQQAEGEFDAAAANYRGTARDISKSVSHAGDYLEGLRLVPYLTLKTSRYQSEMKAGALVVYHPDFNEFCEEPWTFREKVVCFTGGNLAQRLFGDRSYENRKRALHIQEGIYFKRFPQLRRWHRSILKDVETRGYVLSRTGRILELYGTPEDDAKITAAFHGQGTSADHVQEVMRRFDLERNEIPQMQVHDELVTNILKTKSDEEALEYMRLMGEETVLLPGFRCPAKVKRGPNWHDMRTLGSV